MFDHITFNKIKKTYQCEDGEEEQHPKEHQ